MIGTVRHFKVYDDLTFNCPICYLVHFEKDWRRHWVNDLEEFSLVCKNHDCQKKLIIIVKENLVLVTTAQLNSFIKKTNRAMKKNINVGMHLKKYKDVAPECKILMIKGLQEMLEDDKQEHITKLEMELSALKNGGTFPIITEPEIEEKEEGEQPAVADDPTSNLPFIDQQTDSAEDVNVNSDEL